MGVHGGTRRPCQTPANRPTGRPAGFAGGGRAEGTRSGEATQRGAEPIGEQGCEPHRKGAGCPTVCPHGHVEGPSGGSNRRAASPRGGADSQPRGPRPSDSPRRTASGRPEAERRGERGADTCGGTPHNDSSRRRRTAGRPTPRAGGHGCPLARERGRRERGDGTERTTAAYGGGGDT